MIRRWIALLTTVLVTLPLTAGCMGGGPPLEIGEPITETESVPRGDIEELDVSIELGIGEIAVMGGAEGALDAEFRYNVAEWKPIVERTDRGSTTAVTLRQPSVENRSVGDDVENAWSIRLSDTLPCRLDLDIGVGESTIDLAGVHALDLAIDAGVGEIDLSLRDMASSGASVSIDGGVGEIIVHVPEDVGVRIQGDTGIGEFRAAGLRRSGSYLVNDAYDKDAPMIDISIDAGVGSIVVDTEEQGTARA